jgi:folate-dependent tRNA-U54 methylase TrmFO/GidA
MRVEGRPLPDLPPPCTACGGLLRHAAGHFGSPFQPSGINWALVEMVPRRKGQKKHEHRQASYKRGLSDFTTWAQEIIA